MHKSMHDEDEAGYFINEEHLEDECASTAFDQGMFVNGIISASSLIISSVSSRNLLPNALLAGVSRPHVELERLGRIRTSGIVSHSKGLCTLRLTLSWTLP